MTGDGEPRGLLVRAGGLADAGELLGLVHAAYRDDESRLGWTTEADLLGGQRTDRHEIEEILLRPGSLMLIAESGGELEGCCQLQRRHDGTAYLGMLAVRPSRQGHGVGRAIVVEAERIAAEDWSAPEMRMLVIRQRSELLAWYQTLGYGLTGRTEPFPYGDARFGLPKVDDLEFVELARVLAPRPDPA